MATSRDLFLSLLALDAYNRGYNTADKFGTHAFSNRLTPMRGDSALRFQRHAAVSSH